MTLSIPFGGRAQSQTPPERATVTVVGMACPFCAYGIRKHLRSLPGVRNVDVDLAKSQAVIEVNDGAKPTDAQIQKAIKDAGFTPGSIQWQASPGAGLFKDAEFTVAGMKCEYCAANISQALKKREGVAAADVDLENKRVMVRYTRAKVNPHELANVIDAAGKFHATVRNTPASARPTD